MRIAERSSTPESRVIVVDQYYGYDGVKDNQPPGYVHPDMSGEKKIAKNWYDAITPYLNGTAPTPTPTPVPTIVPTDVPTMIASPVVTTTAIMATTTIQPISVEPTSRFGTKHYTIGGMAGASRAGAPPPRPAGTTSLAAAQAAFSPGNPANGTKPPSKMFVRWYPVQRWATGLR